MSRRPARLLLASTTAVSVALSGALLATAAAAAPPPDSPTLSDQGLDPSLSTTSLAEARKAAGIVGATGQITALVELDTSAGVDVAAQGADAVQDAAEETESVAQDVVPTELTAKNATTSTPKRIGTLTNLVAGTLVTGDAAKIRALASKDRVTSIRRVVEKKPSNASTVAFTRALATWQDTGQTGEGVSIAVIDTGLDYTHADFGGPGTAEAYAQAYGEDGTGPVPAGTFDGAKFVGGYDFAGPLYDAGLEEPGSTDVPTPDENPIDSLATSPNSGHGTHVAGSAAGYGVTPDGTTFRGSYRSLTDLSDWQIGPGAAPGAQLYSFKVFGDIGGSTNLTALALDRAADPNGDGDLSDHVDVVNMSLGSDGSPADDPDNELVDALTDLGVVVAVASGNAGDIVDIGGAPGNAASALTVANSVAAPVLDAVEVTGASDTALVGQRFAGQNSVAYAGDDVTAPVAFVGADFDGCAPFTAAQAAAVTGKIAYLWWDDDDTSRACGSAARFNNAAAAGAVGVLLPTTLTVFAAGIAGNDAIPGVQLTKQSTDALLPEIQAGTLSLAMGPGYAMSSTQAGAGDLLNDSSSRGVHGSLGIAKPDVAAPGTGILSAASGAGTAGHVLSGTSMATPHVAGVVALVRAAHPRWSATDVKAAVMNTATHDVTTEADGGGLAYGPERVGSGRVDALQAVQNDVLVYNAKDPALTSVSFGIVDVGAKKVTRTAKVTVRNTGKHKASYDTSFVASSTAGGAKITVSPKRVTVPAGKSTTVTLTLSADPRTLQRSNDPTSADTQVGLPREYVAALTGRLVLDSRDKGGSDLRLPVQAAPRLVSDLSASGVTFSSSDDVADLTLTGRGVASGGWQSLTSPLILGTTSPRLPSDPTAVTSDSAIRSGDLRYVGWSSTAPYVSALGGDPQVYGQLAIGIATEGSWATLGQSVIPVIDIDVDGDGSDDLEAYVWKLDPTVDLTVVATYDLHAPASDPAVGLELVNNEAGDVDTGVFDSNVLVAPINLGDTGIAPGDTPTVSVWTYSPYGKDNVVDSASPFAVDPYDPPFWFETDRGSLVSSDGASGATIPVHRSADATSGKLLVFQHQNADGHRVQVVDASSTSATTTTVKVSGKDVTVTPAPKSAAKSATSATSSTSSSVANKGADKGKPGDKGKPSDKGSNHGKDSKDKGSHGKDKGSTVTAVVTVTGATAAPSGKVTLTEGTKVVGSAKLKVYRLTGTATITIPDVKPGTHTLTATYTGSGTTDGSSGTVTFTVRR